MNFSKKKISHFLGTTLVTSSPLVMTSNIYVTNDVIAHVLWVKWSQTIFFRKVLFNAVILVYWLSRSVKKQKSYGILKMTKIAMTSYSVSQNTLRISIVNYIRLVRRIDLFLFLNYWYIYEILFFTLLLIIGGLQAKLY